MPEEKRVFLMGIRDNAMKQVADVKLYVMTSDYEGFPNALVEAMVSGLPVISTDFLTDIARELIINGENGYVVPVGNKKLLSKAMENIFYDTNLQQIMS